MPARPRIAAVIAVAALAAPTAAGAQSGAGDAQYQDPFAAPPARADRPPPGARSEPRLGVATPDIQRPRAAAKRDAADTAATGGGVGVLPVVAAGIVVVLLAGLALRRRPHAAR